jgi:hypothetical protein
MVWLLVGIVVLIIVVVCLVIVKGRKGSRADWTPGNFCIKCGARHPQDFGPLAPCPRCGGMDYDLRTGPPER